MVLGTLCLEKPHRDDDGDPDRDAARHQFRKSAVHGGSPFLHWCKVSAVALTVL